MHNDKISGVSFPAGPYNMVNSGMSCAQTTKYFQQFLEAGKVAKGWQSEDSFRQSQALHEAWH